MARPSEDSRPAPLNSTVSGQMQRMRRASTVPELQVRRELHRLGLRFRANYSQLPGRPDIVFTRVRLAVFIDGCFWHMCPSHWVAPKHNAEWWAAKLRRNVERDREKDAQLAAQGWEVLHFWEHEDPASVAEDIAQRWRQRRDAPQKNPRSSGAV